MSKPGDVQTDEYRISISREIQVCKNMIALQTKDLARLEARHGLTTERLLAGEKPCGCANEAPLEAWRAEHQGLLAWRQRLREYEEASAELR
jgi:hypothetical protein